MVKRRLILVYVVFGQPPFHMADTRITKQIDEQISPDSIRGCMPKVIVFLYQLNNLSNLGF